MRTHRAGTAAGWGTRVACAALALLALHARAPAQGPKAKAEAQPTPKARAKATRPQIPPTFADVAYGDHPR
jgi:hypothetical protein